MATSNRSTARKSPTKRSNVARSKASLKPWQKLSGTQFALVVLLIVAVGALVIWLVRAATLSNTEPEQWSLPGSGVKTVAVNDTNVGSYIEFTAPVTTTTTTTTVNPNNEVLKTSATYPFVKQDGTPVKINGVNQRNVGSYSAASLCGGNAANWAGWKARGFNAVRLAMDWPSFEPTQGTISTTALQRLDDTINTAKSNGLYVILDPIHLKAVGGNLPSWVTGQNAIQKIQNNGSFYLKTIAARYKNDPKVIAIDLVNEPHVNPLPFDQNSNLTMYNTLINAVRTVDAEKILMIEPITGDSSWDGVNWGILQNKHNLVLSHHSYFAGNDDDGYSASGWGTGDSVSNGTAGYNASTTYYNQMAAHYDKMVGWSRTSGLPLYLGEYGIGNAAANRDLWITQNVTLLNQRNIPRTYWEGCSDGDMNLFINISQTFRSYTNLLVYP